MDVSTITQLIGGLGFPIVMCLLLYKQMGDESIKHEKETKQLTEAINNNTSVINQLVQMLQSYGALK